jgi:hypothetical protein
VRRGAVHLPWAQRMPAGSCTWQLASELECYTSQAETFGHTFAQEALAEVEGVVDNVCATPLLNPVPLPEGSHWERQRSVGEAFYEAQGFANYSTYLTVHGGFEACYLVPLDGNLGRVRIPMARNTTRPWKVRVTVIPIGHVYQYGNESASEAASTLTLGALPFPPTFFAVKVELGHRVGVPVSAGLRGICVRVEVLDSFDMPIPFVVPMVPVDSAASAFGWTLASSGNTRNNHGSATVAHGSIVPFQVPMVIHSLVALNA